MSESSRTGGQKDSSLNSGDMKSASGRADAALVKKAINGDEKAFQSLMEKYREGLFHHIRKLVRDETVIEDLVQETFVKAYKNLDAYKDTYAFSTWLYRIAKNHTIDYLRKKKLDTLSIDEPVKTNEGEMQMELPDKNQQTDRKVLKQQRKKVVQKAIDELPPKYRRVITLRHMEEKSYQEISEELDLPLGTVKAHIFRARELLYKALKDRRGTF